MSHDLSEDDIKKLVSGLRDPDVYFRNLAVESIGRQKVTDERIIGALKSIASQDTNEYVKKAAVMILINSGILSPIRDDNPKWRKERRAISNDLWLGIGLFFGINILLSLCIWGLSALLFSPVMPFNSSPSSSFNVLSAISCILNVLPWVINIGLIVYFAFTRSQIALGMLAGFGIAFALVICLGVVFTAWCFYALSSTSF